MGDQQNAKRLERFVAALAGTDSYGIFYIVNENLTITIITGGDLFGDLADDRFYNIFRNNGFYLHLREKIDRVFGTAVHLRVALLRAVTLQMLTAWQEQAAKLTTEEISREEYDQWRYNYPKFDTTQQWANVPSKELSDALVKTFKDKLKTD